jgi:hypothetical protein
MKAPFKCVAWLLPLVLTGCFHRNQHAQNLPLVPPLQDIPLVPPETVLTDLPPPLIAEQQPAMKPEQTQAKLPSKPSRRAPRHPKQDTSKTEVASNAAPPEVSAIGQLSPVDSSDQRSETEQSIASIDQGLKKLGRSLNDQEQKTAAQIREFLKQARAALASGDVDGAHTLAVKARVLLEEISK